ncbi:hypothetical protein [Candidatus Villigracilis saccharophilus]|uniref:hypothetical protein n=1 Tax=Candidatus Villigracilis saccharophilus TaxID=3140684 RepID=UPI00313708DD|nr:hypothetical protein [Anaerolineales bacterium]
MPIKPTQPRHKVQQLNDGIQIVLPSKKNFFRIIWFVLGLAMWVFMTGSVVFITSLLIIGLGSNNGKWIFIGFLAFILLFLVSLGAYIIYSLLWQFIGKEIIIVKNDTLRISRQIFNRNKFLEYSTPSISGLRSSTPQPVLFASIKIFKNISGQNGMIAFDYGAKTVRFGFEIEESEAKKIVSVLQESFSKSKAG